MMYGNMSLARDRNHKNKQGLFILLLKFPFDARRNLDKVAKDTEDIFQLRPSVVGRCRFLFHLLKVRNLVSKFTGAD